MKLYRVVFESKPAIKIDENRMNFNLKDENKKELKVSIKSIFKESEEGRKFQIGLEITVDIYEDDIDSAIKKAGSFADGILSIITFATNLGLPIVSPKLIYEITQDNSNKEFLRFFDVLEEKITMPSKGQLDINYFSKLFIKCFDSNEINDRILMAIKFYRKFTIETDIPDKFTSLWIGLEYLNPLLENIYKSPQEIKYCPKCGYGIKIPTMKGVKELSNLIFSKELGLFKELRDIRVAILHGTQSISDDLIKKIENLLPKISKLLYMGVLVTLDLPQEKYPEKEPTNLSTDYRLAMFGTLKGGDPENLGIDGSHPDLEIPSHDLKYSSVGDVVNIGGKFSCIVKIGKDVKLELKGMKIYGDKYGTPPAGFYVGTPEIKKAKSSEDHI